jgi:hypothetical protein
MAKGFLPSMKGTKGKMNKGSSPSGVVAGGFGSAKRQGAMPGPANPGQPIAMKKALSRSKAKPFSKGI